MQPKITEAFTPNRKLRANSPRRFAGGLLIVTFSLLVSAAVTAPYYYSHSPELGQGEIRFAHDIAIHLSVMEQFDKVLRSGAAYPRWLPDANYGYGNAWPNFYQPGFYFLTSLVHAITGNWVDTLFVIAVLSLAASALAFYVLARAFTGRVAAAIAAGVYALLPYHAIDLFWRGAVPEYLSFVLAPLIFYFFYRVGNHGYIRYYAGFALCYGSCVMIHMPIAYLVSYILVSYGLVWAAARRDWRIAGRIALAMTAGLMLSSIYLIPAVAETRDVVETVTTLFQYPRNFVTQLSSEDPYNHLLKETFAIQAFALLLIIAAVLWLKRRGARDLTMSEPSDSRRTQFSHESMWIVLGVVSIFLNLPVSYYLARLIPRIDAVVFPYRWLVFACLFTSLLTAALVERLSSRVRGSGKIRLPGYVAFAAAMSVLAITIWFSVSAVIAGSLSSLMITHQSDFLSDSYCPIGAPPAATLPRTERVTFVPSTASKIGSSKIVVWAPLYRRVVITTSAPATARLKTFNFPGWTARIDGFETPISSDSVGAQLVNVPEGTHTVEIRFSSTPARTLGAIFSVAGILFVCALVFADRLSALSRKQFLGSRAELKPADLAVSEKPQPQMIHDDLPAGPSQHVRVGRLCVIVAALVGACFSATMLLNEFGILDLQQKPLNQPKRTAVSVGRDAKLSVGTTNEVTVAADDQSLLELIDAISMKDDRKLESLLQSGRAFKVERDAKVRVVAFAGGKARIEILEGDNARKEAWALEGWLK